MTDDDYYDILSDNSGLTDKQRKERQENILKDFKEYQEKSIKTQFPNNPNGNGNGKGKKSKDSVSEEKKKEDTKIYYPINKYSQGIPLAEEILVNNIPYFTQIIDGKPVYKQEIELSDINIIPTQRTEYLSKEYYSFDSFDEVQYFIDLAKTETLDTLFIRIKNELKKYIDVEEDFINILACDIAFSYFQDKLGMTHYLFNVGDNNVGKSNILLTFSFLGYRPILDTAITPANIYNYGSQLEEGQCIIIEDEIDDIDLQDEKKKLYKVSYRRGTKVTRMYDSNNNNSGPGNANGKRKSSRQQSFFLFCFKMFASEQIPDKKKSKGFLERIIPLKPTAGDPEYDIAEIADGSGDERFKELYQQLMNTRKLLFMYRLLHYNETIPDIKLNIKNRYKQLTKPAIRLFQYSKSVEDITSSLSKYLIEKNQEKLDSMDSAILTFIVNLVSEHGETLYNDQVWNELKEEYPNGEIKDKPYSWYLEGYGSISKNSITKTCETKFGAKSYRDREKGRGLIFNQKTLNKLVTNYSIIEGIKIIRDTCDTCDTSAGCQDNNDKDSMTKNVDNVPDMTLKQKQIIPKNEDITTKNVNEIDTKSNGHSQKVSHLSHVSQNGKDSIPESIHHVNPFSDKWECDYCTWTGDKWFMIKHPCKFNKRKPNDKENLN
jgi:hypothetical protein